MKLQVYSDSGHAWVKVKRDLLVKLGIEEKISQYSYERNDHCYLEEDCDAGILINKLKELNIEYSFKTNHSNKSSKIRNYNLYYSREKEKNVSAN